MKSENEPKIEELTQEREELEKQLFGPTLFGHTKESMKNLILSELQTVNKEIRKRKKKK